MFFPENGTCSVLPHTPHHYRHTVAANIRTGIDLFLIRCINDGHSTRSYSIHRKMFLCSLMRRGSQGLYLAGVTFTDPSQSPTRLSSIITAVNSPTLVKSPKSLGLPLANLYGVTFDVMEYIFFLCNHDVCPVQLRVKRKLSLQRCLSESIIYIKIFNVHKHHFLLTMKLDTVVCIY